ncbi:hypothetical protein [Mammaliicoccus sciuri]|uniref:Uncharacterized protein n=2 Tax=Mammaliicoccus TaxID=2803850 RepID=A0AAW5LHH2_MAMSC|nr:hypothetical protein [Mammaliicoccus sciuri]MCD5141232.1 hypothetical protein [Mammaliicoccus sciuri]MCQ9302681.1 hypothetical protein [Mammaliicoccus sciuri]MDT0746481.1 hypothetical protein [Mammaliicoccus sciuri]MDT0751401.1 hypothetical protein [Mammaliicoccus sciuri]QDR64999.1 hypothetical protein FPV13_08935 [Mammaliicoccus sciuri]
MKYLIPLTISLIALYAFIKRSYKYASVQDEVEAPNSFQGLKQGDVYKDKSGNQIMLTNQTPLDYESDKYKEAETWFSGVGRH